MPNEIETIAHRLKEALSIRNMRQQDLADVTKISKGSISQYMSGYAEPKSDRIYLMANALGVDPVWLMGYDVPMEKKLENRYSTESAQLLVQVKNNPALMQLCEDFMQLDPAQQESVANLVHSMNPDKHP